MAVQDQFLAYVLEQLSGVGGLRTNRMFGAVGLYGEGVFFGLIDDDTVYFKTDETNIAAYQERNMPRFMPFPARPGAVRGYYQVPAEVIEDPEELLAWARRSIVVARAVNVRPRPPRQRKARAKAKSRPKGKSRAKETVKARGTKQSNAKGNARGETNAKPQAKAKGKGRATTGTRAPRKKRRARR